MADKTARNSGTITDKKRNELKHQLMFNIEKAVHNVKYHGEDPLVQEYLKKLQASLEVVLNTHYDNLVLESNAVSLREQCKRYSESARLKEEQEALNINEGMEDEKKTIT